MTDEHHPLDGWARLEPRHCRRSQRFPAGVTILGVIVLAAITFLDMLKGFVLFGWLLTIPSVVLIGPVVAFATFGAFPFNLLLLLPFALFAGPPVYHAIVGSRSAVMIRFYLGIAAGLYVVASMASLYVSFETDDRLPTPSPLWALGGAVLFGTLAPLIRFRDHSDWRHLFWPTFIIVAAGLCLGVWLWAHAAIYFVATDALSTAAGRPYCVASSDYVPIQSKYALSGFTFRAPPGRSGYYYSSFHGLLVVGVDEGEALYNWSYRRMRFEPLPRRTWMAVAHREPLSVCPPRPGFLETLPWTVR